MPKTKPRLTTWTFTLPDDLVVYLSDSTFRGERAFRNHDRIGPVDPSDLDPDTLRKLDDLIRRQVVEASTAPATDGDNAQE